MAWDHHQFQVLDLGMLSIAGWIVKLLLAYFQAMLNFHAAGSGFACLPPPAWPKACLLWTVRAHVGDMPIYCTWKRPNPNEIALIPEGIRDMHLHEAPAVSTCRVLLQYYCTHIVLYTTHCMRSQERMRLESSCSQFAADRHSTLILPKGTLFRCSSAKTARRTHPFSSFASSELRAALPTSCFQALTGKLLAPLREVSTLPFSLLEGLTRPCTS